MAAKQQPLTGAYAVAEAMRQIDPDVFAAYPITPQTPIIEEFSKFISDGVVGTEMIHVESEHSAMAATIGASAAGARAMTATSSLGLALMFEVFNVAPGLRLPIVMPVANRALSAPINIHCDHSDTMPCRDSGWIQLYCETGQEAYEHTLLAVKLSEDPDVLLPTMVMQDGFITSHSVQNTVIHDDGRVREFVGEYKPRYPLLDVKNPRTIGAFVLPDYFFEIKKQQQDAIMSAKECFVEVGRRLSKITGNEYKYFEGYRLCDAEHAIVVMSSTAGTTKAVVDMLRAQGRRVGLLKPILFRPFPYKEIARALSGLKSVAVMDRAMSFGAHAPLFSEIVASLSGLDERPKVHSCVFGLGGREILESDIEKILLAMIQNKLKPGEVNYIGCR